LSITDTFSVCDLFDEILVGHYSRSADVDYVCIVIFILFDFNVLFVLVKGIFPSI
jgi:hypothetical protein